MLEEYTKDIDMCILNDLNVYVEHTKLLKVSVMSLFITSENHISQYLGILHAIQNHELIYAFSLYTVLDLLQLRLWRIHSCNYYFNP